MKDRINQIDSEGRRHGIWEYYLAGGTLWRRDNYYHGTPRGLWECYWDGTPWYKRYLLRIK
jgi:hypothetical protein